MATARYNINKNINNQFYGQKRNILVDEAESVNRSQVGIKHVTFEPEKKNSWRILHQNWYICSIALPVRRNPQHISFLLSQPLPHLRFNLFVISETFASFLGPMVNRFTRQTLPTINRKHFFMNILCTESLYPQKTHNRTLLLVLNSLSTVAILTTETILWICVYASAT
jgi:hypothetical protein